MDNKNENDRGDVDVGAWKKMCTTVSDVRKILKAPLFFTVCTCFDPRHFRSCKQLEDYLYSVGCGRSVR